MKKKITNTLLLIQLIITLVGCKKDSNSTSDSTLNPSEGQLIVSFNSQKYVYEGSPLTSPNYAAYSSIINGSYYIAGVNTKSPTSEQLLMIYEIKNTTEKQLTIWSDRLNGKSVTDSLKISYSITNGYISGSGTGSIMKCSFNKLKVM